MTLLSLTLLAQSEGLPEWADYGLPGLVVVCFLTGLMVPGFLWKQERKRAEDAEQRERDLRERIEDKVLPLIADSSRTLSDAMDLLRRR